MGRRTVSEELDLYFEQRGLSRLEFEQQLAAAATLADGGGKPRLSFTEMRDLSIEGLYEEIPSLKGVAKVNAIKMLADLAKFAPNDAPGDTDEPEPLIADVLDGIEKLPDEKKKEILNRELVRLDDERERIVEVLHGG